MFHVMKYPNLKNRMFMRSPIGGLEVEEIQDSLGILTCPGTWRVVWEEIGMSRLDSHCISMSIRLVQSSKNSKYENSLTF